MINPRRKRPHDTCGRRKKIHLITNLPALCKYDNLNYPTSPCS